MRVLVAEDDRSIAAALCASLRESGHAVDHIGDGAMADSAVRENVYDLVVLDLGLPGMDGLDVLVEARRAHVKTPVIVMTARDGLQARVHGLDAGADDYLIKPFHLEELCARIRSLGRRSQGLASNCIEAGALMLDLGTSQVTFRGVGVELTRREFALLQYLLERAGRLVRRESLVNSLYGLDNQVGNNALEVLIHSLRKKLSYDTVHTVRGFGYMIPREPE